MANKPYDYLASRLADIFVQRFGEMLSTGNQKMVCRSFPQQNLDGRVFDGTNALLASMIATGAGYGIPVWMTMGRKDELGLSVKKGEHSIPIIHFDVYFIERATGKRVNGMSQDEYDALTFDEKAKLDRRCYLRFYPEFNISQTNFAELYPEQHAELVDFFGYDRRKTVDFEFLDKMVREGLWNCPIEVTREVTEAVYHENSDKISIAPRSNYVNEQEYYNDLLHAMASSTGSEMRLDRRSVVPKDGDGLTAMAREALVCELAAATAGSVLGLETTLSDHSVSLMSGWVNVIKEDPSFIYSAVMDASKASDMMIKGMGFVQQKGKDISAIMAGVERAEEARKKVEERREEYRKTKAQSKGKKAHRRAIKISEASRGIKSKKSF